MPQPPQQSSYTEAFKRFPEHLLGFLGGLLLAVLTKIEALMFIILGVGVCLATGSAWWGFAIAWGLYAIFYVLTQYVILLSKSKPPLKVINRDD
jgi:hypothetical protein